MNKYTFLSAVIILLLLNDCRYCADNFPLSKEKMLDIVLSGEFIHLQSEAEIEILRKHKILSATFIKESITKNKVDSVTFLRYDRNGRIKSRTTTECTTLGCLPYIIRQENIYTDNNISQMRDYTFKKKYKSLNDYWKVNDTTKLSLFDWEDYTYKNDTIRIESGSQIWKYIKEPQGRIIYKHHKIKSTRQQSKLRYQHTSESIQMESADNSNVSRYETTYVIKGENSVHVTMKVDGVNIYSKEYIFSGDGLLTEILFYDNNALVGKTRIIYDYY